MTHDEVAELHARIVRLLRAENVVKFTPLEYAVLSAARQLAFDLKMRLEFPDAPPVVHGSERF